MNIRERAKGLLFPLAATLTLGLAPFVPMPHFFEKLTWIAAGRPLAPIDVFDLFMHGAPWVWLLVELLRFVVALRDGREPRRVGTK
jgi:hypothetical protein